MTIFPSTKRSIAGSYGSLTEEPAGSSKWTAQDLYNSHPAKIDESDLKLYMTVENALRNQGLLNYNDEPDLFFITKSGTTIAQAHKSIFSLHSPSFFALLKDTGGGAVAWRVERNDRPYGDIVNLLYRSDAQRNALLSMSDTDSLKAALSLAQDWSLLELQELLEHFLRNPPADEETSLLINGSETTSTRIDASESKLDRVYHRLSNEGIEIAARDRRPSRCQWSSIVMVLAAALIISSIQAYSHYDSAHSGAEGITSWIDISWLQNLFVGIFVVGNLVDHLNKDSFYVYHFVDSVFRKQLTKNTSDITKQVVSVIEPDVIAEQQRCCRRTRLIHITHILASASLAGIWAYTELYKSYDLNSDHKSAVQIFLAAFNTAVDLPKAILDSYAMFGALREAIFNKNRKEGIYADEIQSLQECKKLLLAPEATYKTKNWFKRTQKVRSIVALGLFFPLHLSLNLVYAYSSFAGKVSTGTAVMLAGTSQLSDVYYKAIWARGKMRKNNSVLTHRHPKVVKWVRWVTIAGITGTSFSSAYNVVDKSLGPYTHSPWILIPAKIFNVGYSILAAQGSSQLATAAHWEKIVQIKNKEVREEVYMVESLDQAIQNLSEITQNDASEEDSEAPK